MPPRFRILLPAFALVAFAFGSTDASPETPPAAGPVVHHAAPARYVRRPVRPKPTLGDRAVRIALKAVGVPYRWGGASPAGGFDCSGLVHWAYRHVGVELPHSSYALYDLGRAVPRSHLRTGDLVFFYGLGHVGMYIGRGRMVHAPSSGKRVEIVSLRGHYGGRFVGARRILPA